MSLFRKHFAYSDPESTLPEELLNPSANVVCYTVGTQFRNEQTMVYGVKGLPKVHIKNLNRLPPIKAIGNFVKESDQIAEA